VSSSDGRRHELGAGRCRSRVPRQPSPRPLAARSSGGWLMSLRRESGAEQTVVARGCRGEGWAPPRRRQPPHRCPSRTHGALQVVRRREGMGERSDGAGGAEHGVRPAVATAARAESRRRRQHTQRSGRDARREAAAS